jgi:flagellin
MISLLNNTAALAASNQLATTQNSLQNTLLQLSSGSRINSGADDAAGLSIANGIQANIQALTQSSQNITSGIGQLQVADGAYSQVTTLLNRAVTLATEASNSGLTASQYTAINTEYSNIKAEIDNISGNTTFNGTAVFGGSAAVYVTDGTAAGSQTLTTAITATDSTTLGLTGNLSTSAAAITELAKITTAIGTVAADRGTVGAGINQLQAAQNVAQNQVQNLSSAESAVSSADLSQTVSNMTRLNVLQSAGMSAIQQSNQMQQSVLKLLQ